MSAIRSGDLQIFTVEITQFRLFKQNFQGEHSSSSLDMFSHQWLSVFKQLEKEHGLFNCLIPERHGCCGPLESLNAAQRLSVPHGWNPRVTRVLEAWGHTTSKRKAWKTRVWTEEGPQMQKEPRGCCSVGGSGAQHGVVGVPRGSRPTVRPGPRQFRGPERPAWTCLQCCPRRIDAGLQEHEDARSLPLTS